MVFLLFELEQRTADCRCPDSIIDGAQAGYWIDDMLMITAVQGQAGRATGDPTYLDRAALAMSAYLDKLQ